MTAAAQPSPKPAKKHRSKEIWEQIRIAYVFTDERVGELAKRFDVKYNTLAKRAALLKWERLPPGRIVEIAPEIIEPEKTDITLASPEEQLNAELVKSSVKIIEAAVKSHRVLINQALAVVKLNLNVLEAGNGKIINTSGKIKDISIALEKLITLDRQALGMVDEKPSNPDDVKNKRADEMKSFVDAMMESSIKLIQDARGRKPPPLIIEGEAS